jgi:hypothetical protein
MTDFVDSASIEGIVGAKRHPTAHLGRAVSSDQTVYILHSRRCLASGRDLRECRFSKALDEGISLSRWFGLLDQTVVLVVWKGELRPACLHGGLNVELVSGGPR